MTIDQKIWNKMDKFDQDFYLRSMSDNLSEIEKEDVIGAIWLWIGPTRSKDNLTVWNFVCGPFDIALAWA